MSWQAKAYMLMGRYRRAVEWAGDALAVARAAGDRVSEGRALNAHGVAAMSLGDVDDGEAALRRAMAIARELDLVEELSTAYINLADGLHQAGRSRQAAEVLREGIEVKERATGRTTWMRLTLAEILLDTGGWDEVERLLPPSDGRLQGTTALFAELMRAALALHRGRDADAAGPLERAAAAAGDNLEPQFTGPLGALDAERHRRAGDLAAAAAAVDLALDRILCCTDDGTRVARVAAAGVDVQADAAQRARDRGDREGAAAAAARAEELAAYVGAAAMEGPDQRLAAAYLASARADLARAQGADGPDAWRAARAAWTAVGRPPLAAHAALREAEALVARAAGTPRALRWPTRSTRRRRSARAGWPGRPATSRHGRGCGWTARAPRRAPGSPPRRRRAGRRGRRRDRSRRGSVRPHAARAAGPRAARGGGDEPRDRPAPVHGREDGIGARLADPRQARRPLARAGRGGRPPPRPRAGDGLSRRRPERAAADDGPGGRAHGPAPSRHRGFRRAGGGIRDSGLTRCRVSSGGWRPTGGTRQKCRFAGKVC
jgi:tetratricopeptide (TPR) repeat protein